MKRPDETNGQSGHNGIEALAQFLGDLDHAPRYRGALLPLHAINVLPQPRKTFLNIEELSLDIAVHGQLMPMIVAEFTRKECERYLAVVNRIWGTAFGLDQLRASSQNGRRKYYLLIAGERRYRALKLLWEHGCVECIEEHGKESPGTCFKRHFRRKRDIVEVRLCVNAPPLPALFLQLSENTHMSVPPHEEARAYTLFFRLVREADGNFSIAKFARRVGKSAETVRNALRFFELPVTARKYVERGEVPYGIGLELTRLQRAGLKARELDWWAMRAVTSRKKVPEFHGLITKYVVDQASGQMNLLEIMQEKEEALVRRMHIRKTVQAHLLMALYTYSNYFNKVLQLFEVGRLGKDDSPFSVRSPIRMLLKLIDIMERLLPHLRGLISHAKHARATDVLHQARELATQAERYAQEDGPAASN